MSYPLLTPSDISYQLRYAEENERPGIQPWSSRQTGIYHHRSPNAEFDFFIVLNPTKESWLEKEKLLKLFDSRQTVSSLLENTYRFHLLPLGYIDNWRWYFRDLGDKFAQSVDLSGLYF